MIRIDLNNLILYLIIGLAAGFIANAIAGRKGASLLSNLILGLAGAFISGIVLPAIGLRPWGVVGNFITALVGAVLIIVVARLINSSNTPYKRH